MLVIVKIGDELELLRCGVMALSGTQIQIALDRDWYTYSKFKWRLIETQDSEILVAGCCGG